MQPAPGVLGDAKDLGILLKWAKRFWRDNEALDVDGNPTSDYWPAQIRQEVGSPMKTLCMCFDRMETAHRTAYGQTGSKVEIKVCKTQASVVIR